MRYSHRVAWEAHFETVPIGLCVLHRCDNPPCCNPSHLFLGTKADNNRDMLLKGRRGRTGPRCAARGERHYRTTLTEADVIAIRSDPRSNSKVGAAFGITAKSVQQIRARKSWMHVP